MRSYFIIRWFYQRKTLLAETRVGVLPVMQAEVKLTISATTLTVNWNCTNFWMLMYTDRPHFATVTMVEKLSSKIMTSALSFATCVKS